MNTQGPVFRAPEPPKSDVPEELMDRMLALFRENNIPNTADNRERFLESEEIRKALEAHGVHPERVAATADGRGHVRLDFAAIRTLLGDLDVA